jgi:hypothetical protein
MVGALSVLPIGILVLQALSLHAAGQVDHLRAQIAADAAALVAVHEGEEAARALADTNGAELVQLDWLNEFHTNVGVRVRIDNRESTSTAVLG